MFALLVSIAAYIHWKSELGNIIDMLSSFGFSESSAEVRQLEFSTLNHIVPFVKENAFVQYVFDNADHNVITINRKNTFHSLGV